MLRLLRYGLVGLLNTFVGYGTTLSLMAFGASPLLSNAAGYAVGLCVSYTVNSRWTFNDRVSNKQSRIRFLIAFGLAYSVNVAVLFAGLAAGLQPAVAQAAALVGYQISFFLLINFAVFGAPRTDQGNGPGRV